MYSSPLKGINMIKLIKDIFSLIIALIEVVLILRFVLKLLAASSSAEAVNWVYQISAPFVRPFMFAFPEPVLRGGFTLEFSTLFAILAYAIIGYVVMEVLKVVGKK